MNRTVIRIAFSRELKSHMSLHLTVLKTHDHANFISIVRGSVLE